MNHCSSFQQTQWTQNSPCHEREQAPQLCLISAFRITTQAVNNEVITRQTSHFQFIKKLYYQPAKLPKNTYQKIMSQRVKQQTLPEIALPCASFKICNTDPMGGDGQYFCFLDVNTQISMIVEWVIIVLSVVLIGDAFRKYWKMRGSHNSHVSKMYTLILLWWITFVAGSVYSIILFFLSESGQDQYSDQEMSDLSQYSFLTNWVNAYVVQAMLLLVPYHWSKQITGLFSQVERGSEVALEDASQYKGIEKYVYWILKCYIFLRFIFLGLPFVFIFIHEFSTTVIIFKVMLSCLLLDCVFITLSLIVGMISIKTTKQLKQQIDEDESKRMFNQYIMIITANTVRFGFDLYYVISNVIADQSFVVSQCPDRGQPVDLWLQLAINICTGLFSHFLPIFIILRIYNLEEKVQEMCKSLIITTSDS